MVEGESIKLDAEILQELKDANELFGNMGERVLGFSRIKLDPNVKNNYYNKDKLFDTRNWKNFNELTAIPDKEHDGFFPM